MLPKNMALGNSVVLTRDDFSVICEGTGGSDKAGSWLWNVAYVGSGYCSRECHSERCRK